jgi:predicted dehydrogenase
MIAFIFSRKYNGAYFMANQVNIGIIGTSWWAETIFLPILQNYERANLVAICGRNQERANEVAKKYEISEVYSDYRQMLQAANLDAVIVSTPDDTHYDMVMAAFEAGLHVLCEKPVALNSAQALEMLNKGEQAGLKHMVMFTHHWFPYLQSTKQLLEENFIGKVYHGYFHWLADYALDGAYMWRFDANRANGVLGDLGSHLIHMAQWFLGNVVAVTGQLGYHVEREGEAANDTSQFLLEFKSGAQIQFYVTAAAHILDDSMKLSLSLQGENGMIEAGWLTNEKHTTWLTAQQSDSGEKIEERHPSDISDYFDKNLVGARLFVDCILDDKVSNPSLKEGYEVQRIIDAVIQSHETGCRVNMSELES